MRHKSVQIIIVTSEIWNLSLRIQGKFANINPASFVSQSFLFYSLVPLKVQSCKLYNNKCRIAAIQITNIEIFAFIAVLVFKLLSRKVLSINRKDN